MQRLAIAFTSIAAATISLIAYYSVSATLPNPQPVTQGGQRVRYLPRHYPSVPMPFGRKQPVRSLLRINHPMAFGDYLWNTDGVAAGRVWIRVDLNRQIVSVFRNDDEIGTAVILYGADSKPTPAGIYHVLAKAEHHQSSLYDAAMPYTLQLTLDGIAIHASEVRPSAATHGCIGVPLNFARLLFDATERGDLVAVIAT